MHRVDDSSSSDEAYITPTPLPEHENAFFKDFDSAADHWETASARSDYDIPYDQSHRPLSTLDFDQILPESKPLTIVNGDADDSRPATPERGRSRHRETYSPETKYKPATPPRSKRDEYSDSPTLVDGPSSPKPHISQSSTPVKTRRPSTAHPGPAPTRSPPAVPPAISKARQQAAKRAGHPYQEDPALKAAPHAKEALPFKTASSPRNKPSMSQQTDLSSETSSIFDEPTYDAPDDQDTDPTRLTSRGPSDDAQGQGYDLKPPPPAQMTENIEYLSERLFSADHIKTILKDPAFSSRFQNFLAKYRPDSRRALQQYLQVQKAITAVDYANAVAEAIGGPGTVAAHQDDDFERMTSRSVDELVNNALPGYVTHRLTQIVTEVLVKEITGQNTPVMRELVQGLAEVYCLTDPALPDNPIVYASEEFYRCTQYGKNYTIGRNCRFLQGPKSSSASVARLVDALSEGQEICETILNYRRDGSPFMNLLLIAPLYDNKGSVRYFIGAQVDVNGLIEGGRGLDSFEKLLSDERGDERYGGRRMGKSPGDALGDLAGLMDEDDMESIYSRGSRKSSTVVSNARQQGGSMHGGSGTSTPVKNRRQGTSRRFVGMDDPTDRGLWPAPSLGPSGRLPGVFQNYLLIRPYPSLRITFTSPALRIPGLLQSKFLDRIGGHARIRDQILDALSSGVGVTAKITWLPNAASSNQSGGRPGTSGNDTGSTTGANDTEASNKGGEYRPNDRQGETKWIHCTPLLGSDEKVGVWMVVMVDTNDYSSAPHQQRDYASGRSQATRTSEPYGSQRDGGDATYEDRGRRGDNGNGNGMLMDGIQRAREQKQSMSRGQSQQPQKYQNQNYNSMPYRSQAPPPSSYHQSQASQQQQQQGQGQGQAQSRSRRPSQAAPQQSSPQQHQQQQDPMPPYRPGYGSPKVFPGELKPISSAFSPPQDKGQGGERESKAERARRLAERATAGEESFRDF